MHLMVVKVELVTSHFCPQIVTSVLPSGSKPLPRTVTSAPPKLPVINRVLSFLSYIVEDWNIFTRYFSFLLSFFYYSVFFFSGYDAMRQTEALKSIIIVRDGCEWSLKNQHEIIWIHHSVKKKISNWPSSGEMSVTTRSKVIFRSLLELP